MKSIKFIFGSLLLAVVTISCASQKNAFQKETVTIYGNCGMCENRIETAGTSKKTASVDWDQNTKLANISFDSTKTNLNEILKKIALAGHDSKTFLAPDNVYASLPECCKYERSAKPMQSKEVTALEAASEAETMVDQVENNQVETVVIEKTNQFNSIFESYFLLKDALVKTESKAASTHAQTMLRELNSVNMEQLDEKEHIAWMNVKALLIKHVTSATSTSIDTQRKVFSVISEQMHTLALSTSHDNPMFYQFCPMANGGKGANWLSKENVVKNPYYGSMMLSCGKVTETIK